MSSSIDTKPAGTQPADSQLAGGTEAAGAVVPGPGPGTRRPGFWTGRSELVVAALVLAVAVFLTVGTVTMEVTGDAVPGPRFFPVIVCVVLYVMAGVLTVQVLRRPRIPEARTEAAETPKAHSDWRTVGIIVGAVTAFILVLNPVGWILSSAMLFWSVCYALGSKRPIFDLSLAILFASAIQLAFNAGLGLPLPSGFLEGVI